MDLKTLRRDDDIIMLKNFKGIPARTIGVVKKITKTGIFVEWELPKNLVRHIKFSEFQNIKKYMRIHTQPFGDEFPW